MRYSIARRWGRGAGSIAIILIVLTAAAVEWSASQASTGPASPRPRATDRAWADHLRVVEGEIARGHLDAAVRAWHDAHATALASGGWEGMIAAGDAFVAIGRAAHAPAGARANAREAYVTALVRARRAASVEGALRAAEAFRALGDAAIADGALRVAAQIAGADEEAQQRVREARERWTVAGS